MFIKGIVKKDRVTKNLTSRLKTGDIALIDHKDIDEVAARSLVEKKVAGIINLGETISGKYPNQGPAIFMDFKIPVFECKEKSIFDDIEEGETIEIIENKIIFNNKEIDCEYLSEERITELLKNAHDNIEVELESFIDNTLEYAKKEKGLVTGSIITPKTKTNFKNRHVLVVVRGKDYKADLDAIRSYIDEVKPILIGVDGGGDALLEQGLKPDMVVGDMDSISDRCLEVAGEIVVHAYADGRAPGLERVKELNLKAITFPAPGTSEDIAMLLAYDNGADLIVAVGGHNNMIDFLEKGRPGMASTFLVRLKVGSKLIDAKGVNKLYQSSFKLKYVIGIAIAALIPIAVITSMHPMMRELVGLFKIKLRMLLGI